MLPEKSEQYPECYKPYNKGQCHGFAIFGLDQGSSIAYGGDKQKKHCSGQRAFYREAFSHPTLLHTSYCIVTGRNQCGKELDAREYASLFRKAYRSSVVLTNLQLDSAPMFWQEPCRKHLKGRLQMQRELVCCASSPPDLQLWTDRRDPLP